MKGKNFGYYLWVIPMSISVLTLIVGYVPLDYQDGRVDDYQFFYFSDVDEVEHLVTTREGKKIENAAGFIITQEDKERNENLRDVYLKDHQGALFIYRACWHEVGHWQLDRSYKVEHRKLGLTSFLQDPVEPVCVDMMMENFSGLAL